MKARAAHQARLASSPSGKDLLNDINNNNVGEPFRSEGARASSEGVLRDSEGGSLVYSNGNGTSARAEHTIDTTGDPAAANQDVNAVVFYQVVLNCRGIFVDCRVICYAVATGVIESAKVRVGGE